MSKIDLLRKEIDQLDGKIFSLISERIKIAKKIGKIKQKNLLNVVDKKREIEIIDGLTIKAKKYKIDQGSVKKIWKELFNLSYQEEEKI